MPSTSTDQPDSHYDSISRAWRYLMGESFHYGYFERADDELDTATEALTEEMARSGAIEAGHQVLDVGCGIGKPAFSLVGRFGCAVTGISTSEVGIGLASAEAAKRGLSERARFLVRNAMDNGLEDRSFDRIWVMESSHLMPDKPAMIRDSARVLKPGGRLVLCDIIIHRDLPLGEVLARAKTFDLLRVVFGRAKMETLETYRGICAGAGLEVAQSSDISRQTQPTFERWRRNASRYRDEVTALIGDRALSDFIGACEALEALFAEQVLGYGLIAADKT